MTPDDRVKLGDVKSIVETLRDGNKVEATETDEGFGGLVTSYTLTLARLSFSELVALTAYLLERETKR